MAAGIGKARSGHFAAACSTSGAARGTLADRAAFTETSILIKKMHSGRWSISKFTY